MNQIIKTETINFESLLHNNTNNSILSGNLDSKLVEKLKTEFTEDQKKWYVANFYMYLNYHPTKDFPINLENVWKLIEFANKGNAKRNLENNFVEGEDYQIVILPTEKNISGGRPEETIMLNTETFKSFCLTAKTKKGKEIRKYYGKLETINNDLIKEELLEKNKQLETITKDHQKEIEKIKEEKNDVEKEKNEIIKMFQSRPTTRGFERERGFIYLIEDTSRPGHYKIGYTTDEYLRIVTLNTGSSIKSLVLIRSYETYDQIFAEKMIHCALQPFRIVNKNKMNEWFFVPSNEILCYVVETMESCIEYIKKYDIKQFNNIHSKNDVIEFVKNLQIKKDETEQDRKEKSKEIKKEQHAKSKTYGQQTPGYTTGNYKGCSFNNGQQKWVAVITRNNRNIHIGGFDNETDAAKAYNDYALYLNSKFDDCKYCINGIVDYVANPRDVPLENKINRKFLTSYHGVTFNKKMKKFTAIIIFENNYHYLGCGMETECAILYNKQALYFNNHNKAKFELNYIDVNHLDIEENIILKNQQNKRIKTSIYIGVVKTPNGNYSASVNIDGKQNHLGTFKTEIEAAKAFNTRAEEDNIIKKKNIHKLNKFE